MTFEFDPKVNYRKERLKELTDAQLVGLYNQLNQKYRYYTEEQTTMKVDLLTEINARNKKLFKNRKAIL